MKSLVVKRSVVIAGHRTSISLEDAFWQGLKQIATIRKMGLSELISTTWSVGTPIYHPRFGCSCSISIARPSSPRDRR